MTNDLEKWNEKSKWKWKMNSKNETKIDFKIKICYNNNR
jgi:hypothetical protein